MSSDTNSGDLPSETSESQSQAEAVAGAESTAARGERAAIRIGTQRFGVKPPTAVPRPVLGRSRPATPDDEQSATSNEEPSATYGEEAPGATADASPAPPQSSATAAREAPSREKRPREKESKKPRFTAEPQPARKFPPPNTRAQLSADLEVEYLEALGGQSLDEIIDPGEAIAAELEPESKQRARVVAIHRDDVFVQIGPRQQGILSLRNFSEPPEVGAVVDVTISRFNPAEGMYELTLPGGTVDVEDWSQVREGLIVEARVTGHNKGGLECEVNRLRGFIPASQVSMYRVEDLSQFVDQRLACVITEANPDKRNLVLSHRAMLERDKAEAKEKLQAELEPGQVREGIVRSLQAFGAFVDLGGLDGLIHISQLSWDRIKHASEVLELGQKVKVKIQKIDPQTGKIGLAFRDLAENPWENVARDFPVRSRAKGTVSRLMDFGAFVRLVPGVEGLVHISELSHKRVFRVSDVLSEGQEVEVQVQSIDAEQQRISLSMKALEARATPVEKIEEESEPDAPAEPPKKRKTPLKGGIGGPSTGEQFGLKW